MEENTPSASNETWLDNIFLTIATSASDPIDFGFNDSDLRVGLSVQLLLNLLSRLNLYLKKLHRNVKLFCLYPFTNKYYRTSLHWNHF